MGPGRGSGGPGLRPLGAAAPNRTPRPAQSDALAYVYALRARRRQLGLDERAHFLFEAVPADAGNPYPVDTATLSDLYMLSDVVVLPSQSEGFGLPLAEAAALRVPVVCTDLPAFRELAPEGVTYVEPAAGSEAFAAAVLAVLDSPAVRLRRRILRDLSWDRLVAGRLEPLLASLTAPE